MFDESNCIWREESKVHKDMRNYLTELLDLFHLLSVTLHLTTNSKTGCFDTVRRRIRVGRSQMAVVVASSCITGSGRGNRSTRIFWCLRVFPAKAVGGRYPVWNCADRRRTIRHRAVAFDCGCLSKRGNVNQSSFFFLGYLDSLPISGILLWFFKISLDFLWSIVRSQKILFLVDFFLYFCFYLLESCMFLRDSLTESYIKSLMTKSWQVWHST